MDQHQKPTRATSRKAKPVQDFESVARRLEYDEDKERFEKTLEKIAKAKPKKSGAG